VAAAAGCGFWILADHNPEILSQLEIKAAITRLAISLEFLPLWVWPLLFGGIVLAMLLGMPSIIVFAVIFPLFGFYTAFAIVFMSQVFTSYMAIFVAFRKASSGQLPQLLNPDQKEKLFQVGDAFASFAFYGRVYYSIPLRTVDLMTPMVHPPEEPLLRTSLPVCAAIFIRMLLPTLWCESFFNLFKNISTDPGADSAAFLFWSSALVAYTLIPRVPELFICPDHLKPVIEKIENSTAVTPASSENEEIQKLKKEIKQSGKIPGKPEQNAAKRQVQVSGG
jgi:hypothetical protein